MRRGRERHGLALQRQGGIDDQAALAIATGPRQPGGERCGNCRTAAARRPRPSRGGRRGRCRGRARWPAGALSPDGRNRPHWRSASPRRRRSRASAASTVTESAMPSEKERPRAPDVAMPPTPSPWRMRIVPLRAGTGPKREIAGDGDVEHLARRAEDGDVAAVVDVGAVERRGGAHDRHQLVRDRAGDRRHRRHEDFPQTARRPRTCGGPTGLSGGRAVADGRAQRGAARRKAPAGSSRSVALPRDAPARPPPACRKPSAPRRSARATGAGARRSAPGLSARPSSPVTRAFAGAPGTSRLPPPRAARASAATPRRRPPSSQAWRHGPLRSARGSPAAHRSRRPIARRSRA